MINLKAAKQIGVTIPQSVLYRADKVMLKPIQLKRRNILIADFRLWKNIKSNIVQSPNSEIRFKQKNSVEPEIQNLKL